MAVGGAMMRQQRGVALITAILIVALVASVASYLAMQNHVRIQQLENLRARAQAELLARAAVDWGRVVLADDISRSSIDDLSEQWATVVPPQTTDGGRVGGRLFDQQALFNLNNLIWAGTAYPADMARFRRLLNLLQLPPDLANALVDWLDTDSVVTYPGGAEDGEYLQKEPPYRAANRLLTDVNELYAVRGFTPQVIARLRPFVTALPERSALNINTALPEVLTAVLDGNQEVSAILLARKNKAFQNSPDLAARFPSLTTQASENSLDYGSHFFLADSQADYDVAHLHLQALLQRNGLGWPTVLWYRWQ